MPRNLLMLIVALCLIEPDTGFAQGKTIGDIVQDQERKGSGMQSRNFKSKKPKDVTAPKAVAREGFEEIPKEKKLSKDIPETKPAAPEEDVWDKYKSLAAGSNNKPMARKNYAMGQKKSEEAEADDMTADEEKPSGDEDSPKTKDKKEKSGMGGILEDYKEKQKRRSKLRTHGINE